MSVRKPRAVKRRIAGTYPIDTGEAAIVPDPLRDGGYVLEVNRVPSSYVVPGAPEVLEYDYMRWITAFLSTSPANSIHLGAAGCALPSFFAHRFGGSVVAVEVDAQLAGLVRWAFDPPVDLRVSEARTFVHGLPASSVDVVVRDVFAGPDVPRHLTTVEFYSAVRAALRPGGVFVANIGDRSGLSATRAELAGLTSVFSCVAVASPLLSGGDAHGYGNVVVAASDAPLSFGGLRSGGLQAGGFQAGGLRSGELQSGGPEWPSSWALDRIPWRAGPEALELCAGVAPRRD